MELLRHHPVITLLTLYTQRAVLTGRQDAQPMAPLCMREAVQDQALIGPCLIQRGSLAPVGGCMHKMQLLMGWKGGAEQTLPG